MSLEYLHLIPNGPLPDINCWRPFRAGVIIEAEVNPKWQETVSEWLVRSGCLYMVAWGVGCSSWDDSVDMASIEMHHFADPPESEFVMTTWHANEPLSEAFFFLKNLAIHPVTDTPITVLVHISAHAKGAAMLAVYEGACSLGE